MSVIYGESNSGKTFLALTVIMSVLIEVPFHGLRARKGTVVYIAAEGGVGLIDRLHALRIFHDLEQYPPLHIIPASIDLCKSTNDALTLVKEIQLIDEVQLIVIDTLARALSGGNENNPDDMGAFIRNCDTIREQTHAHIMVIHHSGKDTKKGARGHSSLRGAIDTEIVVTNDGETVLAEITKQRDGKKEQRYAFNMKVIELGTDDDGDAISSCVLIPSEDDSSFSLQQLKGQKKTALEHIKAHLKAMGRMQIVDNISKTTAQAMEVSEMKRLLQRDGIISSQKIENIGRCISRLMQDLQNLNHIEISNNLIFIPQIP